MKIPWPKETVILIVFVMITGCGKQKPDRVKKSPDKEDQLVVMLFNSIKNQSRSQRQDYADYGVTIIEDMPGDSRVLIVPFSNEKTVDELSAIYHEMAKHPRQLIPAFDELVRNPSSNKGTNFASPIRLLAIEANKTELPVIGIIFSEGVFNDESNTEEAIKILARCTNVKLVIVTPVKYQYRSSLESMLKPLGNKRLLIQPDLDSETGRVKIRTQIKR